MYFSNLNVTVIFCCLCNILGIGGGTRTKRFQVCESDQRNLVYDQTRICSTFMCDLFVDITSFEKYCFQAKIGRGITVLKEVAFVNLSLLECFHEHLIYVSGTSSTCSDMNCRRCMSDRTFRFMVEDEKCETG